MDKMDISPLQLRSGSPQLLFKQNQLSTQAQTYMTSINDQFAKIQQISRPQSAKRSPSRPSSGFIAYSPKSARRNRFPVQTVEIQTNQVPNFNKIVENEHQKQKAATILQQKLQNSEKVVQSQSREKQFRISRTSQLYEQKQQQITKKRSNSQHFLEAKSREFTNNLEIAGKNVEIVQEIKKKEAQMKILKVEQKRQSAILQKENLFLEKQSKILEWVERKEQIREDAIQTVKQQREFEKRQKEFVRNQKFCQVKSVLEKQLEKIDEKKEEILEKEVMRTKLKERNDQEAKFNYKSRLQALGVSKIPMPNEFDQLDLKAFEQQKRMKYDNELKIRLKYDVQDRNKNVK